MYHCYLCFASEKMKHREIKKLIYGSMTGKKRGEVLDPEIQHQSFPLITTQSCLSMS